MWKDSSVCIITGRQKTKQPHAEWDENEILFFFFSFKRTTLPFYFKNATVILWILSGIHRHHPCQLHPRCDKKSSAFLTDNISTDNHFSFHTKIFAHFFFFFLNQWNIWMKECLVGNEVFWSYYSKQNYFNLGANALLLQHDLISPTMWWSDHIDPISQHEPERSTLKKRSLLKVTVSLPSFPAYKLKSNI